MIKKNLCLTLLLLACCAVDVHAQSTAAAPPLPRYPGIKTQFNQSLSLALTNEQRLRLYRHTVAQGRYSGGPMLERMFGGFARRDFNLLATTPGLSTTVRLLASDNRNVVIGNARTLRYVMSLQGDGRFEVVGLNRPRSNSLGATDADISFRHIQTGLKLRMEVKNMSTASQRANIGKLQNQIRKMAQDHRLTGEMQVWANRQNVIPEVRAFAQRHGVRVEERLRTGSSNLKNGDRRFHDFANEMDKEIRLQARMTTITGSVKAGMGLYVAYQSLRQIEHDIAVYSGTQGDWLRIGEHSSRFVAGGSFVLAGLTQNATQIPAWANSTRLISVTKWTGRLGIAGVLLSEAFTVGQYLNGDLTKREFWRGQATLWGGFVGGIAGGVAGFKVGSLSGGTFGSLFGPAGTLLGASIGGTVGAIGGAFGGGYAGAHFAGVGDDSRYHLQDAEQQERLAEFLTRHYQLQ